MALRKFLNTYKVSTNSEYTHLSISPNGKYAIPEDKLDEMYNLIGAEKVHPHILEGRQGLTAGPLLIDLDFEYPDEPRFHTRQYTSEQVEQFVDMIHQAVAYFYGKEATIEVEYVVSEKPRPTIEVGKRVKDGLHIVGKGLYVSYSDQHRLRLWALHKHFLQNAFGMEYVRNTPEEVYDKSVCEKNAWYLLGCSKPDRDPYMPSMFFFEEEGSLVVQSVEPSMYSIGDLSIRVCGDVVSCVPERAEEWTGLQPMRVRKEKVKEGDATATVGKESSEKPLSDETMEFVLQSLATKRADTYEDWIRVGMVLKHEGYGFSLWNTWSQQSSKYNSNECMRVWNSFQTVANPVGTGTLLMMLKEDNMEAWKQLPIHRRAEEGGDATECLERNTTISKILQLDTAKWKVTNYESGYKLIRPDKQCLVNPTEFHEQCDHSVLFLQRTHGTFFCYTHKSRHLHKSRAEKIWRLLRPDEGTVVTRQSSARDWNDPELLAAYEVRKGAFEERAFRVLNPPGYMVLVDDTWVHYSRQQLVDMNSGIFLDEERNFSFIVMWLRDEHIRTYSKIGYYVDASECPGTVFNTFTGFAAERFAGTVSEGVDVVLHHIRLLCNHDEQAYEFVIDWLAVLLQRPGFLNGICMIFKGKHGCGKDMFLSWFGTRVVGLQNYYKTARPHIDLFGAFNSSRKDVVFYHIEEGSDEVFKDVNLQQFKNYITDSYASIQLKQRNTTTADSLVKNYNHFAISTNHVISCEMNERRFFGVEASSEKCKDSAYFTALNAAMEQPGVVWGFYQMLKERDIHGRNWSDPPQTEYMKEMRASGIPELYTFLGEFVAMQEEEFIVVKAADLYEAYRDWHHLQGVQKLKTNTNFGRELKTIKGIGKILDRTGAVYQIDKKSLDFLQTVL